MVLGHEGELLADAVHLVARGLFQRTVRARKHGARIHHVVVEEEAEKVVAQVVVGGDVAPATPERVALEGVSQHASRCGQPRPAPLALLHPLHIGHRQPAHSRQIVATPPSLHVGFCRANGAPQGQGAKKARMVDLQNHFGAVLALPEGVALLTFDEANFPALQALQLSQHQPPRPALRPAAKPFNCGGESQLRHNPSPLPTIWDAGRTDSA